MSSGVKTRQIVVLVALLVSVLVIGWLLIPKQEVQPLRDSGSDAEFAEVEQNPSSYSTTPSLANPIADESRRLYILVSELTGRGAEVSPQRLTNHFGLLESREPLLQNQELNEEEINLLLLVLYKDAILNLHEGTDHLSGYDLDTVLDVDSSTMDRTLLLNGDELLGRGYMKNLLIMLDHYVFRAASQPLHQSPRQILLSLVQRRKRVSDSYLKPKIRIYLTSDDHQMHEKIDYLDLLKRKHDYSLLHFGLAYFDELSADKLTMEQAGKLQELRAE